MPRHLARPLLPTFTAFAALSLIATSALVATPAAADPPDDPEPRTDVPEVTTTEVPLTEAENVPAEAAGEDVPTGDLTAIETPVLEAVPAKRVELDGEMLVGATWSGAAPDRVELRSRNLDGTWSDWIVAEIAAGADDVEPVGTEPVVVGEADAVEIRATDGREDATARLEAQLIDSPVTEADEELETAQVPAAGSNAPIGALPTARQVGYLSPQVITRAEWGANESMASGSPTYSPELRAAVVHHTAGSNTASCSQSASIIRGYLSYHTRTLGWKDLGYNALVDKCGTIFEGRKGGLNRTVTGAHASGSNTGTFGISVLGDYSRQGFSNAAMNSVADMIAWKLGGAYLFDPNSRVTIDGRSQYRVFAHRDAPGSSTSCPGDTAYKQLPRIRELVSQRTATMRTPLYHQYQALGGHGVLGAVQQIETVVDGNRVARFANGTLRHDVRTGVVYADTGWTFADIPPGHPFHTEVMWAYRTGITTGWADGTFRPVDPIDRNAMAAFLYRKAGKPAFTAPARSPFRDVRPSDPFYKEITWLAAKGISTGWADGTFRPEEPIDRDAMAAFMYRYAGKPAYTAPRTSPFRDVPRQDLFYKEISWMRSSGLSTGWADGTYRPKEKIERAAMAAFLHRL